MFWLAERIVEERFAVILINDHVKKKSQIKMFDKVMFSCSSPIRLSISAFFEIVEIIPYQIRIMTH